MDTDSSIEAAPAGQVRIDSIDLLHGVAHEPAESYAAVGVKPFVAAPLIEFRK